MSDAEGGILEHPQKTREMKGSTFAMVPKLARHLPQGVSLRPVSSAFAVP